MGLSQEATNSEKFKEVGSYFRYYEEALAHPVDSQQSMCSPQ